MIEKFGFKLLCPLKIERPQQRAWRLTENLALASKDL